MTSMIAAAETSFGEKGATMTGPERGRTDGGMTGAIGEQEEIDMIV